MNTSAVLRHLFAALEHARQACARTVHMVAVAIAKLQAMLLIQRAAS